MIRGVTEADRTAVVEPVKALNLRQRNPQLAGAIQAHEIYRRITDIENPVVAFAAAGDAFQRRAGEA